MSVTDRIKARIDIEAYIGRYVDLKKVGGALKGLCPFHSERTPSFVVDNRRGTWHCFGACSEGGDIFDFVMRKDGLNYHEALVLLAREAKVDLDSSYDSQAQRQRERLFDANAAAAAWFEQVLTARPEGEPGRRYLAQRGIDEATRARFGLGYAPESWTALRDHLLRQGYAQDLLIEAGLLRHNEERASVYDLLRGRLVIPIRDRQHQVCGFSGRLITEDKKAGKYVNTPETPIFHKSRLLFGLDLAYPAIRQAGQAVIVEGFLDVVTAHRCGFANVVASMGTAVTAEQLQLLQHDTNQFVLALDADQAGQQATLRGLNRARQALRSVRRPRVTAQGVRFEAQIGSALYIAALPEGRDPDDVLRQDPEAFRRILTQARPLVDFHLELVAQKMDLTTAAGKQAAADELLGIIQELGDPIERDHYLQRLARLLRLDDRTLADKLRSLARGAPAAATEPAAEPAPNLSAEDYLLSQLLLHPASLEEMTAALAGQQLAPLATADWQHVENLEIFRWLRRWQAAGEPWDLPLFQESLPGVLQERLTWLLTAEVALPPLAPELLPHELVKVLARLRLGRWRECMRQARLVEGAHVPGDPAEVARLTLLAQEPAEHAPEWAREAKGASHGG